MSIGKLSCAVPGNTLPETGNSREFPTLEKWKPIVILLGEINNRVQYLPISNRSNFSREIQILYLCKAQYAKSDDGDM